MSKPEIDHVALEMVADLKRQIRELREIKARMRDR